MTFDWTPGGLRLLELINNKIKHAGGNKKLYYSMRHEARPVLTMPNKFTAVSDLSLVLNSYHKHTDREIAIILGKSKTTVWRNAKFLGLSKNRATSYSTGQKWKVRQWVLNFETGIYYENMKLASDAHAINKKTFTNYMTGQRKNKTCCQLV